LRKFECCINFIPPFLGIAPCLRIEKIGDPNNAGTKESGMRLQVISVSVAVAICGCSEAEPRAEQYFSAHLDEAKQVVKDCAAGTARGEECMNAEIAVSRAKAKERTKRFLGDGKAYTPLP
jgi:hypothetical protein